MNYFVVNVQSNTIIDVITSTQTPTSTDEIAFTPATDGRLNQYYERLKWSTPIDLYSIISKPKTREILPLTADDRESLRAYISNHQHKESVERMAFVHRVSERTIRDILFDLQKCTSPLPLVSL